MGVEKNQGKGGNSEPEKKSEKFSYTEDGDFHVLMGDGERGVVVDKKMWNEFLDGIRNGDFDSIQDDPPEKR